MDCHALLQSIFPTQGSNHESLCVSCIGRFFTTSATWGAKIDAAAAKSLQLCLTVQPHRWQPTRLHHSWDSPGKNTGMGCHFLLQCMKVKVKVKSLSRVQLLATPWIAAYQAPPSMGFSRQEYWSGVPLPSLEIDARCIQIGLKGFSESTVR